jgi:para-nitrobenzyl esterase
MRTALFLASLAMSARIQLAAAIEQPVRLDSGLVSGTAANPDVHVFRGIPYAAAPTGKLRWRAPQPVAHWDGVRAADQFGTICTQPAPRSGAPPKMSEDCLFLNVWTAAKSAGDKRPVMVWIHPGGYTTGSGSTPGFDGAALAKKGVIVVTMNYRLGIFGFFSHPELTKESDRGGSGNYALMDQAAALQWVQANIAGFGGDPNRVTVFGNSAGSSSIANLMGSPQAKGLFQRAIGQSGAWMGLSIGKTRTLAEAEQDGLTIAGAMQARTVADLRAIPAADLLKAGRGGGPVVDGWFIPEDVGAAFAEGKQNDVPLLDGSNQDEGTFFLQSTTAAKYVERARNRFGDQADAFLKLYPAGSDEEANASQLAAFRDELAFVMRIWTRAQTRTGHSNAYLYYFTHQPPPPVSASVRGALGTGATHGSEAQYIFQNLLPPRAWTDPDARVSETLSSYWVNFAANGDPNGNGLAKWPAYDDRKSAGPMVLGDQAEVGSAPNAAQLAFFEALYEKQRR